MQVASSIIWIRVTIFISYEDSHYIKGISKFLLKCMLLLLLLPTQNKYHN